MIFALWHLSSVLYVKNNATHDSALCFKFVISIYHGRSHTIDDREGPCFRYQHDLINRIIAHFLSNHRRSSLHCVSDELQKACRIPLFSVVQPMLPKSDPDHLVAVSSEEIARCQDCLAYINHLCPFETQGWVCSLCGTQNEYSIVANRRYFGGAQARQHLPELKPGIVEAIVPMAAASEIHENNGGHNKVHMTL